jgi:hypothetical protein
MSVRWEAIILYCEESKSFFIVIRPTHPEAPNIAIFMNFYYFSSNLKVYYHLSRSALLNNYVKRQNKFLLISPDGSRSTVHPFIT